MNSEQALKVAEALSAEGKLTRVSSTDRVTKAILFRTPGGRHLAVEINDVKSRGFAKQVKIVFENAPSGEALDWKAIAASLGITISDRQFKSSAYTLKGANLEPGRQMSAYIQDQATLERLVDWYASAEGTADATTALDRAAVEAAMDIYDNLGAEGFAARYPQFQDSRQYWVRPSRPRAFSRYPSKPVAAIAAGAHTLGGGWSKRYTAASLLHNAGYIIVDADDRPEPVPAEQYPYLITGAERVRACALTNHIAPARDRGDVDVTIVAGKLHDEIGMKQAWANVCQALRGPKFQHYAAVPPPREVGPEASTTTTFTYDLDQRATKQMTQSPRTAMNQILYGPPGTGKTFATAAVAVGLCLDIPTSDPLFAEDRRDELMAQYRRLADDGRIEFITFHQSYAYEDFVEGLRPTTDPADPLGESTEATGPAAGSAGFRLRSEDGIFKRICERARLDGGDQPGDRLDRQRPVFKIALGRRGIEEDRITLGLDEGLIHLGWGGDIDWSDERFDSFEEIRREWQEMKDADATGKDPNIEMTYSFRSAMQPGDYVALSDGRDTVRAFGRVTGEYYYDASAPFHPHRRKVDWIWQNADGVERARFYASYFRRHSVYQLRPTTIDWDGLESIVLGEDASRPVSGARPYVLVIDEINRANISKVFGELITLLEPDKRLGELNELKVRLPYSGAVFGVPANLHIVGTMNTADRSIALLDTALRRRFEFRELMPRADLLGTVEGIDLSALLSTINGRIEYLFDREHQIGHAYFINCKTRSDVVDVMRHKVIPLLAEYFYEDWNKVAAVLGDADEGDADRKGGFLQRKQLATPAGMGGEGEATPRFRWTVLDDFDFGGLQRK
ncbi:MAG: GTPase [Blastomonas sp. CACIA14H2]|nr:MAG: GTPase [Blastomonas sp. CACIA14H2]